MQENDVEHENMPLMMQEITEKIRKAMDNYKTETNDGFDLGKFMTDFSKTQTKESEIPVQKSGDGFDLGKFMSDFSKIQTKSEIPVQKSAETDNNFFNIFSEKDGLLGFKEKLEEMRVLAAETLQKDGNLDNFLTKVLGDEEEIIEKSNGTVIEPSSNEEHKEFPEIIDGIISGNSNDKDVAKLLKVFGLTEDMVSDYKETVKALKSLVDRSDIKKGENVFGFFNDLVKNRTKDASENADIIEEKIEKNQSDHRIVNPPRILNPPRFSLEKKHIPILNSQGHMEDNQILNLLNKILIKVEQNEKKLNVLSLIMSNFEQTQDTILNQLADQR